MDFRQLEAYVKVYELRSFSKAAEAIYLSQPSVSAYIGSLEKELNAQLICRTTKEIMPTKSGDMFYEYAKNILALRNKAAASIKSLSDCTIGEVNIMASSVPSQYILPEILAKFHETHPNITFQLIQADTSEVIGKVASQKCEIGFVGAKIDNSKCVYEHFMTERLVVIAPNKERFKNINPQNCAALFYNEYFIAREIGSGTKMIYEEFLKGIGVKPDKLNVSACLNNTQSILNSVAGGLGVSIVSELAARSYIEQGLVLPVEIDRPLPVRDIFIALKRNYAISSVAGVFLKFARIENRE